MDGVAMSKEAKKVYACYLCDKRVSDYSEWKDYSYCCEKCFMDPLFEENLKEKKEEEPEWFSGYLEQDLERERRR